MTKQNRTAKCLLIVCVCVGGLLMQPVSTWAQASGNPALTLNKLQGVFTVTAFQVVNGVGEATGFLTAEATDMNGMAVDIFTNTPVRVPMPLNGPLTGKASLLSDLSKDYVPPPMLSTNLCIILAISVAFVDVTVPGLGLNVHVNQLLVAIRADKATRLGDVLCTILGEDLGTPLAAQSKLRIRMDGNKIVVEGQGPGTLQSASTLKQPSPWSNVLGPPLQTLGSNNPVQLILAPTGSVQFFRLAPQ